MSATTWSKVRGRAARKKAFSFANASSMGLKSGLYGGGSGAGPDPFDGRLDLGLFVDGEVVEHDDVARPEGRHETCSTYARKVGLSIGPSKTAGAVRPSTRKAGDDGVRLPVATRACSPGAARPADCAHSGAADRS